MSTAADPALVTVIVRLAELPTATLPKLSELGEKTNAPETPIPVREALPVPIASVAFLVPADDGWNMTTPLQLAPAASTLTQELIEAIALNWLASVPLMVGPVSVTVVVPGLVTV